MSYYNQLLINIKYLLITQKKSETTRPRIKKTFVRFYSINSPILLYLSILRDIKSAVDKCLSSP